MYTLQASNSDCPAASVSDVIPVAPPAGTPDSTPEQTTPHMSSMPVPRSPGYPFMPPPPRVPIVNPEFHNQQVTSLLYRLVLLSVQVLVHGRFSFVTVRADGIGVRNTPVLSQIS